MKAVEIAVRTWPKKSFKSRFFDFVEGEAFSYQVTVRNVGDEPVRSKGPAGDIHRLEFVWEFPTHQTRIDQVSFPSELKAGKSHIFRFEDHEILSSGFALLSVRTWRAGNALDMAIMDEAGNQVSSSDDSYWGPHVPEFGSRCHISIFERTFGLFQARSRSEVNQSVLLLTAIIALIVNAVFSVYNALT